MLLVLLDFDIIMSGDVYMWGYWPFW